jgi:hypothetical protein
MAKDYGILTSVPYLVQQGGLLAHRTNQSIFHRHFGKELPAWEPSDRGTMGDDECSIGLVFRAKHRCFPVFQWLTNVLLKLFLGLVSDDKHSHCGLLLSKFTGYSLAPLFLMGLTFIQHIQSPARVSGEYPISSMYSAHPSSFLAFSSASSNLFLAFTARSASSRSFVNVAWFISFFLDISLDPFCGVVVVVVVVGLVVVTTTSVSS